MPPKQQQQAQSAKGSSSTSSSASSSSGSSSSSGGSSSSSSSEDDDDDDSSDSDDDSSSKRSSEEGKKSSEEDEEEVVKTKGGGGHPAPKKSAMAKTKGGGGGALNNNKKPPIAEDNNDSDFRDFSLPNLAARAKQGFSKSKVSTPSQSNPPQATKFKSIFSESDSSEPEPPSKPLPPPKASKKPNKKAPSPPPPPPPSQSKNSKSSKKQPVKQPVSKAKTAYKKRKAVKSSSAESSSASSTSSSSGSSSDSDSEVKAAIEKSIITAKKDATKAAKTPKKPIPIKRKPRNSSISEDSEKTILPTRRQTRGQAPRRSRHITGKPESQSESESEHAGNRSPRKKKVGRPPKNPAQTTPSGAPVLPPVRRNIDDLPPIETRRCPVPGCDSSGHLGGRLDRHFLIVSCPVYHNATAKECRDSRSESSKRQSSRKKSLLSSANKSPLQSPNSDQRKYAQHLKDARGDINVKELKEVIYETSEDRESNLKGLTSEWDMRLFKEAQAAASEDVENSLKGLPDSKTTKFIQFGRYEMEVWYQSPYPEEFSCLPKMYICEFCLKYLKSEIVLRRHVTKCVWKHPPGDEIYRKDKLSVFEICGRRYKQYCQSLCLLAKFFLDHKTLYIDVEPFLFYVMTIADSEGCHIVGYFSKEKTTYLNYNVSCILTLPAFQRQGYGRLLIEFSYLLSRSENKVGSPEKPLSDLGLITYRAYWKDVLLDYICNHPEKEMSIKGFSEEMGINSNDIVSTLQYMGMIKYWKGKHIILKKEGLIDEYLRKVRNRPISRKIYPSALKWKPYEPTSRERRQAIQIKKSQETKNTKKR